MKPTIQNIILLMLGLFFSTVLSAQETVTVNNTPGNLKSNLSTKDRGSIVSLTITGTMDARDFKFMRDEMPVLANIDMSSASVTYYNGSEGTTAGIYASAEYPADKVPAFAFSTPKTYLGKPTLVSVKLPKVRAVLFNAFWGCTNLQTVVFPSTVTNIGERAFYNCTSLVNMELPPFLNSLERMAFENCISLTSITWPSTLNTGDFATCSGLRSIHIISHLPQDFLLPNYPSNYIQNVFRNVDKERCILYVPYGTKALYEAADGWKDFKNITEDSKGFILSADSLQFLSNGGSNNSIRIKANIPWTAVSDQSWLRVSPTSGNSDASLTITAEANPSGLERQASLIFTAQGSPEGKITIIQKTNQEIINVTPGSLTTLLDAAEKSSITSLTLKGQIDARDFKTMRDEMPQLADIDLRQATIADYTGPGGTLSEEWGSSPYYGSNAIPVFAFAQTYPNTNNTLRSVQIPLNTLIIEESAFSGCKALSSFTVPPLVYNIGSYAFNRCSSLTAFNIPSMVKYIGIGAFAECTGLKTMIFPPALTVLYDYLFQNCTGLVSVQLSSEVTEIKTSAFQGCTALTSINIPFGVSTIRKSAFKGCSALTSISLPGSLMYIEESAFSGCTSMAGKLVFSQWIKNIGKFSFYNCSKLTAVEFSAGLDSISDSAFDGCIALSGTLTLPSTLTYIGNRAFADCHSLSGELEFPPLLTEMGSYAFTGCQGFSSLTIPPSLQTIHAGAFKDCSGLTTIVDENPYPIPLENGSGVFEGVNMSIPLKVPFGAKDLYATVDGWKEFTNITEESQGMLISATSFSFTSEGGSTNDISLKANVPWTAAPDQAWLTVSPTSGNSGTVLTITAQANPGMAMRTGTINITANGITPQSIRVTQDAVPFVVHTTTGNFRSLFTDEQYKSITKLVITGTMNAQDIKDLKEMPVLSVVDMSGVSITAFNYRVYKYIYSLPANSFPSGENNYSGIYSMANDSSLNSIILPSNLERIEATAFKGCINLTSVIFPSTLTYIGDEAFRNCFSLKAVQLPASLIQLGYGAFRECRNLSSVELPEGITMLSGTFEGCISLRNLNLPSTLNSIGDHTFSYCNQLTQIEIPPLLTTIGTSAFYGCTSLTSIILPASVTSILRDAFAECTTMSLVILPRSLTTIEDGGFWKCGDITSIYCYAAKPPQPGINSQGVSTWSVNFNQCILYVPYGSKQLYEQSTLWKEFKNIVEMDQFSLPVTSIIMEGGKGSTTIVVTSATNWTATSSQTWLTITPSSGTGSATLTLTAEANPTAATREAIVNFNINDLQLQDLAIIQNGIAATIDLTPGSLSSRYSNTELMGMTSLTITGTIDARDFKTIKERMPALKELNLSDATIVAYTGFEGTIDIYPYEPGVDDPNSNYYPANAIPPQAFYNSKTKILRSITLPVSLTSIGNLAFSGLTLLDSITVPSAVISIGYGAFTGCSSLVYLKLPPSINHLPAFLCSTTALTSVTIPSTVSSIGYWAFGNCQNLATVYSNAPNPPEILYGNYEEPVIFNADKSNITLYVPYGSKKYYAAAPNDWKEFTHVVEMPGFRLSAVTIAVKADENSTAKVGIVSDGQWTAISDQSWLSISPASGTGADSITFSAQANTMDAGRMATVTISAPDVVPQTITVIQEGKPRTLTLAPGTMANALSLEEMNGITNLFIKGVMDARDFRIIRDQMPLLTYLDLSQVKIAEFQEPDPTTGELFVNRVNMIPNSAFFNQVTWKGKTSLTQVIFPSTLEKIGIRAFSHAAGLTTLRFPFTMRYIECNAFNSCPYLHAIYSYSVTPPESHEWGYTFYNTDKTTCILYVPFGTKALYAASQWWKDFQNMVEMAEFKIMTTKATLEATKDSIRMRIQSQVAWITEASEQWLTVSPASGNTEQVITITAEANMTDTLRTGIITFKALGYLPQIYTIYQKGLYKSISLAAGTLSTIFSNEALSSINGLIITGTMDARDFKTIRDNMPWLAYLDITGVTITAYSGTEGTIWGDYTYKANAIPPAALYYYSETYSSKLTTVLLPASVTLIDDSAFHGATALTTLVIPSSVRTIERYAFSWTQALDTIVIPEGVDSIYTGAFSSSMILTSVTIPASIKYIGDEAFGNLNNLRSIYSYAPVPLELSDTTDVFWQVYTDSCTLYVPYGSKALYAVANQWKDFTHIVEMPENQSSVFDASVLTTGVNENESNTAMKCYPNPFTDQMAIEVNNPSLKEITAEIYSISGQMIRILTKGRKGAKISLIWKGDDEYGRKVISGMYLLKVNGQTTKVVKR